MDFELEFPKMIIHLDAEELAEGGHPSGVQRPAAGAAEICERGRRDHRGAGEQRIKLYGSSP